MQTAMGFSQQTVRSAVMTKKLKSLPKKPATAKPGTLTLKPGTGKKIGTGSKSAAPKVRLVVDFQGVSHAVTVTEVIIFEHLV